VRALPLVVPAFVIFVTATRRPSSAAVSCGRCSVRLWHGWVAEPHRHRGFDAPRDAAEGRITRAW
jgi:hypothetical protein